MAGSGKSLTPFYVAFAVIAVAGGLMIARTALKSAPRLTSETVAPLASGPRGVTMGSDSAPLEVMELSDFECPWCGQFATLQMPDVKQRLVDPGKVRWRFVHYPLSMHSKGPYAHLAAACANEQGRFWEMHDIVYQFQADWSASRNPLSMLEDYARRIGLDMDRYESCISERRAWGRVLADQRFGDSIAPGTGTPTFFVNGRQLRGTPTVDELIRIADSISARPAAAPRSR